MRTLKQTIDQAVALFSDTNVMLTAKHVLARYFAAYPAEAGSGSVARVRCLPEFKQINVHACGAAAMTGLRLDYTLYHVWESPEKPAMLVIVVGEFEEEEPDGWAWFEAVAVGLEPTA